MKKYSKLLAVLMAAAVTLTTLAGCSLVSVNEEKDLAQIVATVGDKEITKSEFVDEFNYMASMYQSFGMDLSTFSAEDLNNLKMDVLDQLISYEVQYYHAIQDGIDKQLTEEELKEIQDQVDDYDGQVFEQAEANVEARLTNEPGLNRDEALVEEYRTAALSFFGKEMSQPETRQFIEDFFMGQLLTTKLSDKFNESITISEEEVRAAYDEQLASDKESYSTTPSSYKGVQEAFERVGGVPPLYSPTGFKRFRYIKIAPEAPLSEEYTQKKDAMSALEAEIGQLSLKDAAEGTEEATADSEREKTIREEYAKLKAERDKLYEDYISESRTKADEAYSKLSGGTPFETLLLEYTADTDFTDYSVFAEKGKLMSTDAADEDWPAPLKTAALALTTKGSYTEIIEHEESFHILQYVGDEPSGERRYEDYKDAIREQALSDKQSNEWNTLLEEWLQDDTVITRYPEVLQDI